MLDIVTKVIIVVYIGNVCPWNTNAYKNSVMFGAIVF